MRDKQVSGDTYNHKEHVYADPVSLRKEIEQEKQKASNKPVKIKKYESPSRPPPLPSGPRDGRSSGNALYAELVKKINVPSKSSVRELANLFGGTISRGTSLQQTREDLSPPPVPEMTPARNVLVDSPPESLTVPEINEQSPTSFEVSGDRRSEPRHENRMNAVEMKSNKDIAGITHTEENLTNEVGDNVNTEGLRVESQTTDDAEVKVIDVRINSEAGIEIGAELPESANTNDGAVLLIKSVKHDPFAVDNFKTGENGSSESNPERVRSGSDVARNVKPGSESTGSGSTGSGSVKRKKKKDLESGLQTSGHMRRNLIIITLFLLIIFILVLVAVGILISYNNTFS